MRAAASLRPVLTGLRPARLLAAMLVLAGCVIAPPYGEVPSYPAAEVPATTLPATSAPCGPHAPGMQHGSIVSPRPPMVAVMAWAPAPFQVADRGIGGTGTGTAPLPPVVPAAPSRPTSPVDRGIGGTGTGIVGVITGFGSICVNGLEVAYGPKTVFVGDAGATEAGLRVGQLVLIDATGAAGALQARQVTLRYEVVGPVDSVNADGSLSVAGQMVTASAQLHGAAAPPVGSWVAVSGLRDSDGTIAATRIDPVQTDTVLVHGVLTLDPDGVHVGALKLHVPRSTPLPPEGPVTASGHVLEGVLYVEQLVPDLLQEDPSAMFGPQTERFVVETFAGVGFGIGFEGRGGTVVVQLRREAGGRLRTLAAVRAPFDYAPAHRVGRGRAGGSRSRFAPAPVPRHPAAERGGRRGGFGGTGGRFGFPRNGGPGRGPGFGPGGQPGPGGPGQGPGPGH